MNESGVDLRINDWLNQELLDLPKFDWPKEMEAHKWTDLKRGKQIY